MTLVQLVLYVKNSTTNLTELVQFEIFKRIAIDRYEMLSPAIHVTDVDCLQNTHFLISQCSNKYFAFKKYATLSFKSLII